MNRYDGKQLTFLLTGCKTSIDALRCYWTNAFILQDSNKKQINVSPFANWANVKMNVNVGKSVKTRNYTEIGRLIDSYKLGDPVVKALTFKDSFIKFANPMIKDFEKKVPDFKI